MAPTPLRSDVIALASAAAAFFAGILTAFTVSVGGEMPIGELILIAVVAWVVFHALTTGSFPVEVPHTRLFAVLLLCQAVAFAAYVFSDLYRHSSPHDMYRGWARMVFLAIDIVAIAYLFGCSRLNLLLVLTGQLMGDALHAVAFGALYNDMWKFGVGVPLTYLAFFLAAIVGRPLLVLTAFALSVVHFALDYRSFGAICLCAGAGTLVTLFPKRFRVWMAVPAIVIVAIGMGTYAYVNRGFARRAARSDISRTSMIAAAFEGFRESPFIGQGSWFSKSPVFSYFVQIRAETAKEEHVGGFADASVDPGTVAIHSQILVALAEGGVFGATFFLAFGAALVHGIYRLTVKLPGSRFTGIYLLILTSAAYNWLLSPFSGAHRVYIAIACGLLFYLPPTDASLPAAAAA